MTKPNGLFNHNPLHISNKRIFNVGGNGDCGFRSIAACIIDNHLNDPHIYSDLLHTLLTKHYSYYPKHQLHTAANSSFKQQIDDLLQEIGMQDLIPALAYTLRQIAIEEMNKRPSEYRGAFVDRNENTSPAIMSRASTYIDESSIAAVANALNIPIEVEVLSTHRSAKTPLLLCYNQTCEHPQTNPRITIQLKSAHYMPYLDHTDVYSKVKPSKKSLSPAPQKSPNVSKDDTASILAKTAKEDQRMSKEFETTREALIKAVVDETLDTTTLIEMYVNNMSQSDYLRGRVAYVNAELGHEFFEKALTQQSMENIPKEHEHAIINELIHAIARAASIGHLEPTFTTTTQRLS